MTFRNFPVRLLLISAAVCMLLFPAYSAQAQEEGDWPRVIEHAQGQITIYQPQAESFAGNILKGRAAVSVIPSGKDAPIFGAVWLEARIETDRDEREVTILDIKVPRVRFSDATPEQEKKFVALLEQELPQWELVLSLDRLIADLELAEREKAVAEDFKHDPPKIIIKYDPAVLIIVDGEPFLEKIEGSKLKQVGNTPSLMVYDSKAKKYYLNGGQIWMVASNVKGPWSEVKNVPNEVAKLTPEEEEPEDPEEKTDDRIPEIIVTSESVELIVIDGAPKFSSVAGGDILYVDNTESDVLLETKTQKYFVLLSGRWYSSKSLDEGPWTFVPPDELPESFAKIPEESINGHLLPHVAGTEQAQEAVIDNQIPQTSAIDRNDKSLKVEYDGRPKFEEVEGADLEYAVNTSSAVFKVEKMYYCCNEAVWYESKKAKGPWAVCTDVPDEIYTIPPDNPHYNVKYVYVYDSTPEVVYVGYYPGYYGSYYYHGSILWGTGWWYNPWVRGYYYPRFRTWGLHVRWSPWGGWRLGFSYGIGPFRFGFGRGRWGRWGRGRYGGYRGGRRSSYRAGYRAGSRNAARSQQRNTYKRQNNANRNVSQQRAQQQKRPQSATGKKNNVYADKNGNVHRKTDSGNWQSKDKSGWSSTKNNNTKSQMNKSSQARSRGTARTRQSRGRSGGGGRRR